MLASNNSLTLLYSSVQGGRGEGGISLSIKVQIEVMGNQRKERKFFSRVMGEKKRLKTPGADSTRMAHVVVITRISPWKVCL